MADIPFFGNVFEHIDKVVQTMLLGKTAEVMSVFSPLLGATFTVYLAFVVISYFDNPAQQIILDLFKRVFAWALIIAFSFNVAQYNEYVVPVITHFGEYLSAKFAGASQEQVSNGFDVMLTQMIDAIGQKYQEVDTFDIGGYIMLGIQIFFMLPMFVVFSVLAGAYLLIGKVISAILAIVGPVFIALFLFPATRQYTMNWIGQVVTYNLLIFLTNVLVGVFIEYMQSAIGSEFKITFYNAFIISVGSGLFFVVLLKIPELSSLLGGGINMNGISNAVRAVQTAVTAGKGGMVAGALGMKGAKTGLDWGKSKLGMNGNTVKPIKPERAGR